MAHPDDMNRVISSTWHVLEQVSTTLIVLDTYSSIDRPPLQVCEKYWERTMQEETAIVTCLSPCSTPRAQKTKSVNATNLNSLSWILMCFLQRMASVAALHRTLLEMHGASPSAHHIPLPQLHPGSHYYDPAPPMYAQEPRRSPPHSDISRRSSSSSQTSRKRQRTTHHPASPISASSRHSNSPRHRHRSPPSPRSHSRSSSRSDSADYSPRSRASMTIGSLLSSSGPSNGEPRRPHYDHHHHVENHGRGVNGYLPPPASLGPISV